MTGIDLIAEERQRQINVEGWTADHDDEHGNFEMAWAAVCYAAPDLIFRQKTFANSTTFQDPWPWDMVWDKRPHHGNVIQPSTPFYVNRADRLKQLAKAGALIAAEIDRIQRCGAEIPAGRDRRQYSVDD